MSNKVFLYRTKAADDRDCCAYISISNLEDKHICIDGKFCIYGACYSSSLGGRHNNYSYDEIDTILTEEQYNRLLNPSKDDDFTDIIETLTSDEAEDFFAEILASEQEYMMEEYGLNVDDFTDIYNSYSLDYMDRAIINYVYDSAEDVGYAEMENHFATTSIEHLMKYFDYKSFGEDIVNDSNYYLELDDGRIVELNY